MNDILKKNKNEIKASAEVSKFLGIIENDIKALGKQTTAEFWLKNKTELPTLFNVATFLASIPASSAFIERFFSIAGLYSNKRTGNVSVELLCARALLKANARYLQNIIL